MAGFNWVLDGDKFLTTSEVRLLLETAQRGAQVALAQDRKAPVRDCFIIRLALATGLRVMEIAQLKCGDFFVDDRSGALVVKNGKGSKKRLVRFNNEFEQHYYQYLYWKQVNHEPTEPDDPLLLSSNTGGHMTTRAIEKAFKRTAIRAGLAACYSIHSLRHTYACALYKASGYNLRMVQKQLGHSRSHTTEVYADVMNPELIKALKRLYL